MEARRVSIPGTICYLVHFADGTTEVLHLDVGVPEFGSFIVDGRKQPVWHVIRRSRIEPQDPGTGAEYEIWVVQADLAGYVK